MPDGDALKKVRPGDPLKIPAPTYNAFIDAARALRQGEQNRSRSERHMPQRDDTVLVRNDSGADRQRFDILGIDGPLITPADNLRQFKNRLAFKGVMPQDEHRNRFMVLLEPLKAGRIGHAALTGCVVVRLSADPEDAQTAGIVADEPAHLEPGASGASILLSGQDSGDNWWAVVRIGVAGDAIETVVVQDIFNNYLEVRAWHPDTGATGDLFYVAKPPRLRHSPSVGGAFGCQQALRIDPLSGIEN